MRTNVYVDAFNLYDGCLKGTPYCWLDLAAGHYLSHPVRMRLANPPPGGPATVEVIKTEEKGSDVNLATYLLLDAFKQDCEAAVVIWNDSDLKEPITVAQRELGLTVAIINPHPPRRRSRALQPTFFKQIRESALRTCQFPAVLANADGKTTSRRPEP
jgi:hypothetical protein